jgi:outer membrane protein assembly factor BamE (lipoprotein component of BamABCDE complex)
MRFHNKLLKLKKVCLMPLALGLLVNCSLQIENHGKRVDTQALANIIPGITKKEQVRASLGPPSTKNDFGTQSWIYMGSDKKKTVFFGNQLISRLIVKITFDSKNVVTNISRVSEKDTRNIDHTIKETSTAGQEIGILQQLLGNIGRFNTNTPQ